MIFLGDFFAFFLFFFRDSLCRNMKELKFLVLREFWYFTSNDDMQFSCWLVFSSACFLLCCFFFSRSFCSLSLSSLVLHLLYLLLCVSVSLFSHPVVVYMGQSTLVSFSTLQSSFNLVFHLSPSLSLSLPHTRAPAQTHTLAPTHKHTQSLFLLLISLDPFNTN